MLRRLFFLTRAPGIALAIFILFNLVLTLEKAELSLASIWLAVPLPEPELSILAAMLGLALLLPHDVLAPAWARWAVGGTICCFLILAGASVVQFYYHLHLGMFETDLPVPFSLLVCFILLGEFVRVSWFRKVEPKLPLPAWCFVNVSAILVSFFLLFVVYIVTYGRADFREDADAAVILGAKVYDDGRISDALRARLDTGVELFHQGAVEYLIMSGGVGNNGISEPQEMARYAFEQGGVPLSQIFLDEEGTTTVASARNCGRIARQNEFEGLLVVSQYFHCARVKMIFDRAGTKCRTVPTCARQNAPPRGMLAREGFYLFREAVAFPFYFLYYR